MNRFYVSLHLVCVLALAAAGAHAQTVIPSASDGASVYSGTSGLCLGCTISNESNVIDDDLSNFATVSVPAGVLGSAYLGVMFPNELDGRYRVGFLVEEANGLLDAQVLERLALRTYRNGALQSTAASPLTIRLSLLDTQRGYVTFVTERPFDELRLSVGGVAGTLTTLRVFYAGARVTTEPSLDYTLAFAEDGATVYDGQSGLCLGCSVSNDENVIDASFENSALISVPVGVTGSAHLGVTFTADQDVPSLAGFVIRNTSGLTDAQLLGRLRITTYRGGAQQETFSGGPSLSIQVLDASGRKRVSARATQPFDELRLSVTGLASALVEVRVVLAGTAVRSEARLAGSEPAEVAKGLFGEAPSPAATASASGEQPATAALSAAYPNPTRGSAAFTLTLATPQPVRVAVYDALGRRVAVLHDGRLEAGMAHPFRFDGSGLPGGVYVYRAEGHNFVLAERMLLVK